tara:strand:+ start:543 stop:710 length:168 start_codon:yes stop_codon:yes gene_type:complete
MSDPQNNSHVQCCKQFFADGQCCGRGIADIPETVEQNNKKTVISSSLSQSGKAQA